MTDLSVLLRGRRKLGLMAVTAHGATGMSRTGACAGQDAFGLGSSRGPRVPGPQPAEVPRGRSDSRAAPRRLGLWAALTPLPLRSSLEQGALLIAGS